MPNNHLFLEIESGEKLQTKLLDGKYDGFGDDGSCVHVAGAVRKITVTKNGFSQFALWIDEDGRLTLTDYAGMHFQLPAGQNLTLTPSRSWRER